MPSTMPQWEQRFRAPSPRFPTWSREAPDRLAFVSNEDGSDQVHVWDRTSGRRDRVTNEPVGVIHATVAWGGTHVAWFSDPTGSESGRWLAAPFEGGEPRPLLPGAPEGWPAGIAAGARRVAAVLATRTGFGLYISEQGVPAREIVHTEEDISIGPSFEGPTQGYLSADEHMLCLLVPQDGDDIHPGLQVLDVRTGTVLGELADGPGLGLTAGPWSPLRGDARIAIADERGGFWRPSIWDPLTGSRTRVDIELPGEVQPVDWWPDGGSLLLAQLHEGRHRAFRWEEASGRVTAIRHPEGEILGAGVRPDGAVWLRVSNGSVTPRILDQKGTEALAPQGIRAPGGVPYQPLHLSNPRGERVHGFLATPDGRGPFPILMRVHGGPDWLYLDTWIPEVQAFVDHGIAVAMVNYRGSLGYGRAWRDAIIGNVGFPEVEDTVAGLDHLISVGLADPERAAIGGWSWGGYVTLLALGLHPDRWRCGVAGVPVGDYAASYDDSAPALQAFDRSLLGGSVYEVPELVRERSPITYVDRVKAPALVMVAEHDTRCPPDQALHWVEAVRERGGDVELYRFDQGHSSLIVDEEVRQVATKLAFLLRHLRP